VESHALFRRGCFLVTLLLKIALAVMAVSFVWAVVLNIETLYATATYTEPLVTPSAFSRYLIADAISWAGTLLLLAVLCLAHGVFSRMRDSDTAFMPGVPQKINRIALLIAVAGALPFLNAIVTIVMSHGQTQVFSTAGLAEWVLAAAVWALGAALNRSSATQTPAIPAAEAAESAEAASEHSEPAPAPAPRQPKNTLRQRCLLVTVLIKIALAAAVGMYIWGLFSSWRIQVIASGPLDGTVTSWSSVPADGYQPNVTVGDGAWQLVPDGSGIPVITGPKGSGAWQLAPDGSGGWQWVPDSSADPTAPDSGAGSGQAAPGSSTAPTTAPDNGATPSAAPFIVSPSAAASVEANATRAAAPSPSFTPVSTATYEPVWREGWGLGLPHFIWIQAEMLISLALTVLTLCFAHAAFSKMRKKDTPFAPGVSRSMKAFALLHAAGVILPYMGVVAVLMIGGPVTAQRMLWLAGGTLVDLVLAAAVWALGVAFAGNEDAGTDVPELDAAPPVSPSATAPATRSPATRSPATRSPAEAQDKPETAIE